MRCVFKFNGMRCLKRRGHGVAFWKRLRALNFNACDGEHHWYWNPPTHRPTPTYSKEE